MSRDASSSESDSKELSFWANFRTIFKRRFLEALYEPIPWWKAFLWFVGGVVSIGWHYHNVETDRAIFYKRSELFGAYIAVQNHMSPEQYRQFIKRADDAKVPKGAMPALQN